MQQAGVINPTLILHYLLQDYDARKKNKSKQNHFFIENSLTLPVDDDFIKNIAYKINDEYATLKEDKLISLLRAFFSLYVPYQSYLYKQACDQLRLTNYGKDLLDNKVEKIVADLKMDHHWYDRLFDEITSKANIKKLIKSAESISVLAKCRALEDFPETTSVMVVWLFNLLNNVNHSLRSKFNEFNIDFLLKALIFTLIDLKPYTNASYHPVIYPILIAGLKKSSADNMDAVLLYEYKDSVPTEERHAVMDALFRICIYGSSLNYADVDEVFPIVLNLFSWATHRQQRDTLLLLNFDQEALFKQPPCKLVMQLLNLRNKLANDNKCLIDAYIMRSIKSEAPCWDNRKMLANAEPLLYKNEQHLLDKMGKEKEPDAESDHESSRTEEVTNLDYDQKMVTLNHFLQEKLKTDEDLRLFILVYKDVKDCTVSLASSSRHSL